MPTLAPEKDWDVVVIGAGMTGSWVAKELAESGLSVALLDAGPLPAVPSGSGTPESHIAASSKQPVQSRHPAYWMQDPGYYVDDIDHPYSVSGREGFVWIRGRQVGGRSLTWGGVTLRFSDFEFDAAARDGFGPAWPLGYRDLEPYYARVESFMGAEGAHDSLATLPDGDFRDTPRLTAAELSFRDRMLKRWPERPVIRCRAIPDAISEEGWSQRSTLHAVLPAALRSGRVEVFPDSIVSSLLTERAHDRVTGAACLHRSTHERFVIRARAVALCASTIETLRILLNSSSEKWPEGLANSSGCLGQFLMDHVATFVAGPAQQHGVSRVSGSGLLIPRFRNLRAGEAHRFIRGYGLWGRMGHECWAGSRHGQWTLCAMGEVLPRVDNRVQLDASMRDAWGIPVPSIRLEYSDNEREILADAECVMQGMVAEAGWTVAAHGRASPGAFVHEVGGARMGSRPTDSVLNPWSRSWDVPNLYVLDGASFVTSGWQNPTLTMVALALRGAGHLARELRAGHFH